MVIKKSYLSMIRAFPGGWDAISAALGMSRMGLENRIYERKGQGVLVDTALQLQAFSGTTDFAEAVAAASGGYFVRVPEAGGQGNEELLAKFNELYAELGVLSATFKASIQDDEIDGEERQDLADAGQKIKQSVEELLVLSFGIYCRPVAARGVTS